MTFRAPNLGETTKDAARLTQVLQQAFDQMESESAKSDPVGRLLLWPAASPAPQGWLAADGATYNKTRYPELNATLMEAYGATATTFDLPNISAPSGTIYIIRAE